MENKPRKPWLAGLLAFSSIGLGHIYSGEAKKGLALYMGQVLLLAFTLPIIVIKTNIFVLLFVVSIGLFYYLYNLYDAVKIAKSKSTYYSLRNINKWFFYLGYWLLTGFVLQPIAESLIKEYAVKAYRIPSGAMIPTLLVGDHILVNKFIYKSKNPQRGDIVVFESPDDPSKDFVKRLIGIEGDVIEIKDKVLYVNDIKQHENYIVHCDKRIISESEPPRDNFGPATVPPGSLFFMGDNRDNSYDSRFWGYVNKDKIRGKVMSIYWSWDKETGKVRWKRIGYKVGKTP